MYRHEKIVLIILSYVIGFTTAYIAFGITPYATQHDHNQVNHKYEPQLPTVHSDTNFNSNTNESDKEANSNIDIILTEEGMFANAGGNERVISGKLRDGIQTGPGFHVNIPRYESSPDGEYVYYCEQQSEAESICHEYIYLVQEHLIKPLRVQGQTLTSSVSDAGFSWKRGGVLASPQYVSLTPEAPWEMVSME